MPAVNRKAADSSTYSFRVSDVVDVPLRGTMLRLRLIDGAPSMSDLRVGSTLRLRDPRGTDHDIVIRAHSVTGGRATQKRLDATREFDIMIEPRTEPAEPIEIGWTVHNPA